MGGLASRPGLGGDDLAPTVDLGPPEVTEVPLDTAYSLESVSLPRHYVRHRASELWADPRTDEASELFAFDTSFVLVQGLAGSGCSLRSTNFPLEYVRHRDGRLYISEYDGSAELRSDASFEIRCGELSQEELERSEGPGHARTPSSGSTSGCPLSVCLMLAACPGKYACLDKDNRLVVERYRYMNRMAYHFRLLPGFALQLDANLGMPLVWEEGASDRPCRQHAAPDAWKARGAPQCSVESKAPPLSRRSAPGAAPTPVPAPPPQPPEVLAKPLAPKVVPEPRPSHLDALPAPAKQVARGTLNGLPVFCLPAKGDCTIEEAARAAMGAAVAVTAVGRPVASATAPNGMSVRQKGAQAPPARSPTEFEAVD